MSSSYNRLLGKLLQSGATEHVILEDDQCLEDYESLRDSKSKKRKHTEESHESLAPPSGRHGKTGRDGVKKPNHKRQKIQYSEREEEKEGEEEEEETLEEESEDSKAGEDEDGVSGEEESESENLLEDTLSDTVPSGSEFVAEEPERGEPDADADLANYLDKPNYEPYKGIVEREITGPADIDQHSKSIVWNPYNCRRSYTFDVLEGDEPLDCMPIQHSSTPIVNCFSRMIESNQHILFCGRTDGNSNFVIQGCVEGALRKLTQQLATIREHDNAITQAKAELIALGKEIAVARALVKEASAKKKSDDSAQIPSPGDIYKMEQELKKLSDVETSLEIPDQGFTRPSILIVLPFRNAAVKWVSEIIRQRPRDIRMVHNKSKFEQLYGSLKGIQKSLIHDEVIELNHKKHKKVETHYPDDYRQLFAENFDDCFKLGISFGKTSMKLMSDFYSSDIIIASPLGLRVVTGADGDTKRDYDFLSSITTIIFDQTDVFHMQNWLHIPDLFELLNLLPKKDHGTDINRILPHFLDGKGGDMRQNIIISRHPDPHINSLARKYFKRSRSTFSIRPLKYPGSVSSVISSTRQLFQKIHPSSFAEDSKERMSFFKSAILTKLVDEEGNVRPSQKRTLIVVSSYCDFVDLKKYLLGEEIDIVFCSEYSESADITWARGEFYHGRSPILLITERLYFFNRFRIRGARHLILFQLPMYEQFYPELLNLLEENKETTESTSCLSLFSKYDELRLERIAGSDRATRMIEGEKDSFMFA